MHVLPYPIFSKPSFLPWRSERKVKTWPECHYDEKSLAREGDIRNGECVFNQYLPSLVCSLNHKVNKLLVIYFVLSTVLEPGI